MTYAPPPFPDQTDHAMLSQGWKTAAHLLDALADRANQVNREASEARQAAPDNDAALWRRVRLRQVQRMALVLESLVRRLLWAMSALLPRLVARPVIPLSPEQKRLLKARLKAAARGAESQKDDLASPPPSFRLIETLPFARWTDGPGFSYPKAGEGPRIRSFDTDPFAVTRALLAPPLPPPPPEPAPEDPCMALMRRVSALQDVLARPDHHARRMARWRARQSVCLPRRRSPLRPGLAPGQLRRRRRRDLHHTALAEAHALACRAPDTS